GTAASAIRSGRFLTKSKPHLPRVGVVVKLAIQQARLDVAVVLVLVAGVLADIAFERVVEDLADLDSGVDPDRLDGEHFERPVAGESDIPEAGRDMDEQSEASDRG